MVCASFAAIVRVEVYVSAYNSRLLSAEVVTLFCGIPSAMVYLLNRIMSVALENIAIKDKANMAKIYLRIFLCA